MSICFGSSTHASISMKQCSQPVQCLQFMGLAMEAKTRQHPKAWQPKHQTFIKVRCLLLQTKGRRYVRMGRATFLAYLQSGAAWGCLGGPDNPTHTSTHILTAKSTTLVSVVQSDHSPVLDRKTQCVDQVWHDQAPKPAEAATAACQSSTIDDGQQSLQSSAV